MPGTAVEIPRDARREATRVVTSGRIVTALLVGAPLLGFACLLPFISRNFLSVDDAAIGVTLYIFTGFGISIGFHRLLTHRSFKAKQVLKVLCAIAGSMALEGSVITWVAIHRRHHMHGDQAGDPHSPLRFGTGTIGILKGFLWAHVGWLFAAESTDTTRFAPDLHRDRGIVIVDRLFPLIGLTSLILPFILGWAISGTLIGALSALFWAGVVRMAVLHHVTWSINSVCHLWGRRPFVTSDRSTNVSALALLSFGESWHNFHHAAPSSARHGVLPHEHDLSAWLISRFERLGWATKVRWPNPAQIVTLMQPGPTEALLAHSGFEVERNLSAPT